jgi:hypothetical protein
MLRFPDRPESGLIGTSRFVHGQVFPGRVEDPSQGGYSWLRAGAEFSSLAKVPTVDGGTTDLSRYPARRGFEDLVMVVADPDLPFSWTAVTFPRERYVWFALKDPRVLTGTIFWISNGGRHYAPWDGRHVGVMGLEEVTSYFHYGLGESARPNPFSRAGYPTCLLLRKDRPLFVRYIMAVASVPAGFGRVASIRPVPGTDAVEVRDEGRRKVTAGLDVDFLFAETGP